MKVIDLLNKIANGEEVPKKIKFHDLEFKFRNKGYYCELEDKFEPLGSIYILDLMLKDKVEIIEEDKKIEKINDILRVDDLIPPVDENMYKIWQQTIKNHNKINELIEAINEKL